MKSILAIALAAGLGAAPLVAGAEPTAAPDNTERNVRDRGGETLLPTDQGSSESDVRITREIRQALMGAQELSLGAKNVKVITVDGVVTLRGPVESRDEKQRIGALAQATDGVVRIHNDLEVSGGR
jgi:osmotically-inducible protein OsmY